MTAMTVKHPRPLANRGDWLEVHGLPGLPSRRGQIIEVIGAPAHVRYRVRWDEQHESVCYPADGVILLPRKAAVGDTVQKRVA